MLVDAMADVLCPSGTLVVDVDDTLYEKSGRKVDGAGSFRDAVRSTRNRVVYAAGLNLVIVTLRVDPPWGGMPIGVPVGVRLHRKGAATTIDLAEQIIRELAAWLPSRRFALCGDGAYASLAGRGLPATTVTSRMRRDAAIFEAPPARSGKRGRPRTNGTRLPTPAEMTTKLKDADFAAATVEWRGASKELLVYSIPVLWYSIEPTNLVALVIVRDPTGDHARRLLLHHRSRRQRSLGRLALRRSLVHRVRQPRGQTGARRR
ncbi:MAG: transposase, partial [Acidimicrobiales bacterium]